MKLGDKYYIQDIESGVWNQVSEEDYNNYENWRKDFSKKIVDMNNIKPRYIVMGTMSDPLEGHKQYPLTPSEGFKRVFMESQGVPVFWRPRYWQDDDKKEFESYVQEISKYFTDVKLVKEDDGANKTFKEGGFKGLKEYWDKVNQDKQ